MLRAEACGLSGLVIAKNAAGGGGDDGGVGGVVVMSVPDKINN